MFAKHQPVGIMHVDTDSYIYLLRPGCFCVSFGYTYNKIGTIQRRLAWPLRKDDTQIREAFSIFDIV